MEETKVTSGDVGIMFFDNPPHIYFDSNGKVAGALHDYMQDISKEMGVKFSWSTETVTIPREISLVQEDPKLAIGLLAYTDERAKLIGYTESPYFSEKPGLALMKENPLNKVSTVNDILNLTIGYASNGFTTPMMKNEKLKLDLISDPNYHRKNIEKMVAGRLDAVYAPGISSLLMNIEILNMKDKVKTVSLPENESKYYFIFSKKAPDLIYSYNQAFKKLKGALLYRQKLAKYIDIKLLGN